MGPNVHFIESKNKEFRAVQMEMEDRHSGRVLRYLLIEEGKEVPHHYKDGPRQRQEEFADVKRPLIEIIYSYRQKRTWSGSFRLPHLKQNAGCWLGVRHLISAQFLFSGSWVQGPHWALCWARSLQNTEYQISYLTISNPLPLGEMQLYPKQWISNQLGCTTISETIYSDSSLFSRIALV